MIDHYAQMNKLRNNLLTFEKQIFLYMSLLIIQGESGVDQLLLQLTS